MAKGLVREIRFKEKSSIKDRKAILAKLDDINPAMVLSVGHNFESMVVMFENGMDMMAFMVASGLATMTIKEPKPIKETK
jgi:hypothetical protein